MEIAILILLCLLAAAVVCCVILLLQQKKSSNTTSNQMDEIKQYINEQNSRLRLELQSNVSQTIKDMGDLLDKSQFKGSKAQINQLAAMQATLNAFAVENEQKLNQMRETMTQQLASIQADNNKRLEQMQSIVDEKLQKTLEEKMTRSFALVNERLEQVYKGLGEMQNLAVGVGDLKKVLSNVKTRGILGEIQLSAILSEILSKEQYDENVVTKKGSGCPVEFAVKLPGDGSSTVYLPIDSKFPGDTYAALKDAYDSGDKIKIDACKKQLAATIKQEAKDISQKYIDTPNTTEFAIMFLPFEGLYAEVVNSGMVEVLQRDYKVNIAGPGTMAALLNSLQMGFKTLAVQKRSVQVWQVLGEVKTEFDKFADVLSMTQQRLEQANKELDKLVGVRTRQIQKKLSNVAQPDCALPKQTQNETQ